VSSIETETAINLAERKGERRRREQYSKLYEGERRNEEGVHESILSSSHLLSLIHGDNRFRTRQAG